MTLIDLGSLKEMETLVAVAHHRNHHQYYDRNREHGSARFGSFGSPPTDNSRGINCRAFQSGAGLLPNPPNSCTTAPSSKREFSTSFSPKTPSTSVNEDHKSLKKKSENSMIPIAIKINFDNKEGGYDNDFHFSEHWAGPAYSCSPPPSSLPMPNFSLRPKRAVSLDLHTAAPEFDLPPMAKSAPASPTRERCPSPSDMFDGADCATKNLRRILNLDNADE
ncbi:uncharacterized protein LOC111386736 [Olea europaea var. sylvestris]|uniref:Uncharacterized protein n=1 Tax=Olea europaea subsp. europaea TaxID=158383 RepID=A0A8S0P6C9_OLEEU|nr:uncharacterized protein LOC111386736 [Olea europaea var. sylvestris]CAA2933543.1 Hypothetical predicted protein [Olea europaea subsp. europaea]